VDALRQLLGRNRQTRLVAAGVGEQPKPVEKPKGLENGRIDADTHPVVPLLNAPKRRPAGECAFCHDLGGKTSPTARVADIAPKLPQGAPNGYGGAVRCRHSGNFAFH
jgi:hypothetical protein